ncbi:stage III sporulation protein AF [Bacillus licheniformis]|nr:stage III sporulation protein AF [Bacillus licheniformis]
MEFLTEWLTNIILFILMAIVIDMLLPNSSMQKYAKMVISLLLIVVILNPIFSLFRTDPDVILRSLQKRTSSVKRNKKSAEFRKKEIQASQQAYILEQMAVQLEKNAEGRFTSDKYKIDRVEVSSDSQLKTEKDLSKHAEVSVFLKPASEKTVQAVAPVEINTDRSYQSMQEREKKETGEVREQLAGIWEISPDKITVHIEGGERSGNE